MIDCTFKSTNGKNKLIIVTMFADLLQVLSLLIIKSFSNGYFLTAKDIKNLVFVLSLFFKRDAYKLRIQRDAATILGVHQLFSIRVSRRGLDVLILRRTQVSNLAPIAVEILFVERSGTTTLS